jgi:hypothetical protein
MNHAITIGGLLFSIGAFVGLLMAAFGLLMVFAAGMSDASDDGTGGQGCVVFIIGVVLLIGCISIGIFV